MERKSEQRRWEYRGVDGVSKKAFNGGGVGLLGRCIGKLEDEWRKEFGE